MARSSFGNGGSGTGRAFIQRQEIDMRTKWTFLPTAAPAMLMTTAPAVAQQS
jgi:hypothetical protein